jgi:Antirestriction protein
MSSNTDASVVASVVPSHQRSAFLPSHLGRHMIIGEALVFGWLDRLCIDYNGGLWDFYTLSNGEFYIAPINEKPFKINVPTNGFSGEMSADAAGIVASLFALCDLANRAGEDKMINQYHWLRDFAIEHAESRLIMGAID